MKCTLPGCPGEYQERRIVHTVRHRGRVAVVDHVPAEVCLLGRTRVTELTEQMRQLLG